MKKALNTVLFLLISITSYTQVNDNKPQYNFDFEIIEKDKVSGWSHIVGNKKNNDISLDSQIVKSGKYSAVLENKKNAGLQAYLYTIPENYKGNKITLSAYVKTEDVTDGYAGLIMRIDPQLAFDNMHNNGIKGTTDWTEYKITLKMNPKKTKQFVVGGLLTGKGKMWIDGLKVSIDDKDISQLEPIERTILPAEKDVAFEDGSLISIYDVDKSQIENLKTLGLVWGFLKYYHPNIAKGNFNWDYELFRIIPKIMNLENNNMRDNILLNWIESLGAFEKATEVKTKKEIKIEPDLYWIQNSSFSKPLVDALQQIKNAKRPKEHYYIGFVPRVGNPEFKNEQAYAQNSFPDAGFRILSLFRYWNIIQYYFPYKNLIEEDWKNVLEEFIPIFIHANNETEYTLAVLELIARVHDTHANIWGDNKTLQDYLGNLYAPIEVRFIENRPVVSGYYDVTLGKETGLEIGDIITTVNNISIEKIIKNKLTYTPASNYPTQLREIAENLLRTNDSVLTLEYERNGINKKASIRTFSATEINLYGRYQITDTSFKKIEKDICYINNGSLKRHHLSLIKDEIINSKGLIIDNRNYPSDFPIYSLSNIIMPASMPFVKFTNSSIETPGLFTFEESLNAGIRNKAYYKGKVVIIVNEITQSSAEYHAMAYRVHPNAVVIGSTTAGADGNVSFFYLPGGISTAISGIGVYYPDGKETQRIGIVPDIEVKPSIEGLKNAQDELLLKAIEIINQK